MTSKVTIGCYVHHCAPALFQKHPISYLIKKHNSPVRWNFLLLFDRRKHWAANEKDWHKCIELIGRSLYTTSEKIFVIVTEWNTSSEDLKSEYYNLVFFAETKFSSSQSIALYITALSQLLTLMLLKIFIEKQWLWKKETSFSFCLCYSLQLPISAFCLLTSDYFFFFFLSCGVVTLPNSHVGST